MKNQPNFVCCHLGYAYHPPAMSGQPQYSGPMYNQSNAAYDKPMFSPNGPGYQGMNADYGSYNNQAMLNMKRYCVSI